MNYIDTSLFCEAIFGYFYGLVKVKEEYDSQQYPRTNLATRYYFYNCFCFVIGGTTLVLSGLILNKLLYYIN
ncbi:MAG TPA: hypothetical protein VLG50_08350 [Candidatus Saccharimonadales bacterium]|nr:hypothetical protein [Candidatus Saccharimonadales bacterium]